MGRRLRRDHLSGVRRLPLLLWGLLLLPAPVDGQEAPGPGHSSGVRAAGGSPSAARASSSPGRAWLGAGLGLGVGGGVDGGAGLVQLAWQRAPHHVVLRGLGLAELYGGNAGELGLLYGRVRTGPSRHLAVATGLSRVSLSGCDGRASPRCVTLGIPLTAEVALQTRFVGLGLQGFTNLNKEAIHGGVVLFLQAGWMP